METMELDFAKMFNGIFNEKRVLVTGHTGFKGSWLSLWLYLMGAKVVGYALPPSTVRDNYVLCSLQDKITDIQGDIRDKASIEKVFTTYKPEFVFHLAAQPLVRHSYLKPAETFETNIMGTVNILEQIRTSDTCHTGIIITSDKCYENKEQIWGYRENDRMGGYDPYSASKGCAEHIASSYSKSFFNLKLNNEKVKSVATVRAGNVIGGGDWSEDRIIPDCIRALESKIPIKLRNPNAVRPWQHVLEPLYGYLLLASKMYHKSKYYDGGWNFGPDLDSIIPVRSVVDMVIDLWGDGSVIDVSDNQSMHEASLLNLDCTKAKLQLGWKPQLNLYNTIDYTLSWYKNYQNTNVFDLCKNQIMMYYECIMRD